MAFAKQKLYEVTELKQIAEGNSALLDANQNAMESRRTSGKVHKPEVKQRVAAITDADAARNSPFPVRQQLHRERFRLPLFPTTTIGSFPQTDDIRQLRAQLKKGALTQAQYEKAIEDATVEVIRWQEALGIDVLVHGEFERNDMVEYFGSNWMAFSLPKTDGYRAMAAAA